MVELAWEVARHLPYLRRYARAIMGDRERGDAQVCSCLARLIESQEHLRGGNIKIRLFQTLHSVWSQADAAASDARPSSVIENHAIVAGRLGQLTAPKRQILALTVLEGFSVPEAAAVMGLTPELAAALLRTAKEELRWQRPSRIMIIEDEPVIALDIASIVAASGHSVVGVATTHREAVAMARHQRPELILADIQLADESSGLDAVFEILAGGYLPVVFITAFPERLLTGLRSEPSFLITKPFDDEMLRVAISQALVAEPVTAPAMIQ